MCLWTLNFPLDGEPMVLSGARYAHSPTALSPQPQTPPYCLRMPASNSQASEYGPLLLEPLCGRHCCSPSDLRLLIWASLQAFFRGRIFCWAKLTFS